MENIGINKDKLVIPDFLKTLWKLVNDKEMDGIIYWNEDGKSFRIITKGIILSPNQSYHFDNLTYVPRLLFF